MPSSPSGGTKDVKQSANGGSIKGAVVSRTNGPSKRPTVIVIDEDDDEPDVQRLTGDREKRWLGKRTARNLACNSPGRSRGAEHYLNRARSGDRASRDNDEHRTLEKFARNPSPSNKLNFKTARKTEYSSSSPSASFGERHWSRGRQSSSSTGRRRLQPQYLGTAGKMTMRKAIKSDDNSNVFNDQTQGVTSPSKRHKLGTPLAPKLESFERPCTPTVFQEDEIVTTDFLQSHCWVCKKRVKDLDGHVALYAMHVHPTLMVPCCLVCCDELEAMDIPVDQDDLEQCCACGAGEEGGALLLCDACPNGFCETCTAQAWGGGLAGVKHVQRLMREDTRSWACLQCNPPSPLVALQIPCDSAPAATSSENEGQQSDDDSEAKRIVAELDVIEDDLEHCDQLWDDDNVQRLEMEIRKELSKTVRSTCDLDRLVAQEVELWKTEHIEHTIRVQDKKVDLLERLNRHGISDDQFYKYRAEGKAPNFPTPDDSTWRRRADAEIQKRIDEENARALQQQKSEEERRKNQEDDPCDSDAEEKQALSAVEDLCTSSQPEDWETEELLDSRKQWKAPGSESREYIDKKLNQYMARDDLQLKNAGSQVRRIDRQSDENAIENEFALASSKSSCGTRIRRDTIQSIVMRQKNDARRSLPGQRNSPTRSANTAEGAGPPSGSHRRGLGDKPIKIGDLPSAAGMMHKNRVGFVGRNAREDDDINDALEPSPCRHGEFWDSCVELCSEDEGTGTRSVRVARELASKLKPHQVDGIKFMWENSFKDLGTITTREDALEERGVGGCILAHMMGLGKSLQVVALVHTLLHHPALRQPYDDDTKPFLHKVLLIVPVNTIVNWTNEFDKWTGKLQHSVRYFDYSSVRMASRPKIVQNWSKLGGVLLIGAEAFTRLAKKETDAALLFRDPGPDVVFVDEGHTLLKTNTSEISKVLGPIKTKRRIALTGTPFNNNLKEYFKLSDWCRPGSLGTFAEFDRTFVQKIMAGLASDSTTQQVAEQVRTSKLLFNTMAPFMQRRGVSYLKRDLPPCQTAVLYIRQSKLQSRLYRSFERYVKRLQGADKLSFISHYQMIRPLHNHPYCLMQQAMGIAGSNAEDDQSGRVASNARFSVGAERGAQMQNEKDNPSPMMLATDGGSAPKTVVADKLSRGRRQMEYPWIESALSVNDKSKIRYARHGYKIVLLLQILANATAVGDKVVVFSQCLRTLDFIEEVLETPDWDRFCKGRYPGLGSWKKGVDYLRIDGSVNSSERGDLVSSFQEELGGIKAFLLSIEAGGIGINLVAANRVVIFDNHWNPTVSSQAFHRCYRYGQEKPVFGYRFITQGSMEEKIYKRSMNKSGVAARVVDQQFPERSFTDREIAEIQSIDTWVQCDSCQKWRILFFKSEEDLPENWYCNDNNDPMNKECDVQERNADWYEKNRTRILDMIEKQLDGSPSLADAVDPGNNEQANATKKSLVMKDSVLVGMGLLDLFDESEPGSTKIAKGCSTSVISEIQFQEMLLMESGDLAIEASHTEAEAAAGIAEEVVTVTANHAEFLIPSNNESTSKNEESHHDAPASKQSLSSTKRTTAAMLTSSTNDWNPNVVDGSVGEVARDPDPDERGALKRRSGIGEAQVDGKQPRVRLEEEAPHKPSESSVSTENKSLSDKSKSFRTTCHQGPTPRESSSRNSGMRVDDAIELIDSDCESMDVPCTL